ncbi:CD151 antigen-like [Ornithodoros turicata]|uniref:CD151 antigen-like n=1 Tax=Ornithodoros turicata TaxID=34597 RepID=UPI003139198B
MFLHQAMRYYRLWIYTCNVALLAGALAFTVAASWTLSDFRASLVPGLRLADPSFAYAAAALLLQGGLLQAIGCLGALRMNSRLLNAYWGLLLALLLGDALAGFAWLFRYRNLVAGLRAAILATFQEDYGSRAGYRFMWDRLQSENRCCGVQGPSDFNGTSWLREQRLANSWFRQMVPESCCPTPLNRSCAVELNGAFAMGCYEPLLRWLQKSADLLCVIGFCVMAFLKLCFLAILRYEIREMIQKIRVLTECAEEPCLDGGRTSFAVGGKACDQSTRALLLDKRGSLETLGYKDKHGNGNNNDAAFDEYNKSSPV